jgi:histidinol-phosphate aminotransferase
MKKQTMDIQKIIRPNCAGFQPYVAGKPIETIKRELGLKHVIKLASNENPLGPSPRATAAIQNIMNKMYFYPDASSWDLRHAVAEHYKKDPKTVILGAGSDEIIELIAKTFFTPSDEIVISEHAFVRYEMAGKLMGSKIVTVPMKKGFVHDLAAMAKAVTKKTKAIFIANPNNPTGTYITRREFETFMRTLAKQPQAPLVILDEAYYEYARVNEDYPDTLSYAGKYPNLVILRTFSKIYALAGLRAGYGFASPEIVDYIERIRPPFNLNLFAQVAGAASLADKQQVKKGVALVEKGKKYLYKELAKLGLPYIPTAANFVLVGLAPRSGQDVFKKLLQQGVIVRPMAEYSLPEYIRVTIGLPEENSLFITALKKVL